MPQTLKQYLSVAYIKEKWAHQGFQKYFRNMGWMFTGRVFTLFITFFVNIYIARYLKPLEYGILNYVLSFVSLFVIFSSLGVDSILLRELSLNKEKKYELIGSSFLIKLIASIISILLIVILTYILKITDYERFLIIFYSFVLLFYSTSVIDVFFQASILSRKSVLAQICATLIITLYKIILIAGGFGVTWFLSAYLLESLLLSLFGIYIYTKNKEQIKNWIFRKEIAIYILKNSWPIVLSSFFGIIYLKIDQLMIRNILDNYQLGVYSAAVKLSEVWYFIPGVIAGSLFPAIINAKKTNPILYENRLKKLYWFLIILAILIAIPVSLFSSKIIEIIFGEEYIGASSSLKIYIWAGIAIFLQIGITQYLLAENKTIKFLIITLTGALVNVILNLFMIPSLGITGAAWASLISYSLVPLMLLLWKDTSSQITSIIKFK